MSENAEQIIPARRARVVKNPVPWYTPRFWHGMRFSTWLRVLARNKFDVSFFKLHTASSITFVSLLNSLLAKLDAVLYTRRTSQVELPAPPIFILGHWRAGTTLLHELLILDAAHTFPNTYQCFVPHHFVLTEKWLAPLTQLLIPRRRPMDNMAAGWRRPQEDEFALCNLGVPSPYLTMLFPRRGAAHPEYLDLGSLSPGEQQAWGQALDQFFRRVTFCDPRRIVVKSPPHTARINTLLEIYPQAKFVHLVRDPFELFVSTVGLWRSLNEVQRMQAPSDEADIEEYVLATFERMYAAFERDRQRLDQDQIVELRYEDLVQNPLECMRKLYTELDLGDFTLVESAMQTHLASVKSYRPNRYQLTSEQRDRVAHRWKGYLDRYGYAAVERE